MFDEKEDNEGDFLDGEEILTKEEEKKLKEGEERPAWASLNDRIPHTTIGH